MSYANTTHIETVLPSGSYKEYSIPKKNNKVRKIVAPDSNLLHYQQSMLPYLTEMFYDVATKYDVLDIVHGFVPNRSCVTAATKHIGYETTIMLDISNFFDSVNHSHFQEPDVVDIIQDANLWHKDKYAAQGFSTSPMIANIAICKVLNYIKQFLDNYIVSFSEYTMSLYADDLQISIKSHIPKHSQHISHIINEIRKLLRWHGFTLNKNKTRIRYNSHGYRKILGINVGTDHIRATRATMRKLRAAKHQSNRYSTLGLTTWSKCHLPKYYK